MKKPEWIGAGSRLFPRIGELALFLVKDPANGILLDDGNAVDLAVVYGSGLCGTKGQYQANGVKAWQAVTAYDENRPGSWVPMDSGQRPGEGDVVLIQLYSPSDGFTGDEDKTFDLSCKRADGGRWLGTQDTYAQEDIAAWRPIEVQERGM